MMFASTSRRDDMIALFYMMIMLLNSNHFPFTSTHFNGIGNMSVEDLYEYIYKIKQKYSLVEMSQNLHLLL